MERKLFTVIMPTLNCGSKIVATIQSVLQQNRDLFEFIIIDGGSTDDTLHCIDPYKDELTLISEADKGVYDAMNKGIKKATGRYLYFLGAGDHLRSNIFEDIKDSMPEEPLSFVYGDVFLVSCQVRYDGKFDKSKITVINICQQAIFYERTIFQIIGDYKYQYRICADYAFNIQCLGDERIKLTYLDHVIADFEGNGLSYSGIDLLWERDGPNIIRRHLGIKYYLIVRIRQIYRFGKNYATCKFNEIATSLHNLY